MYSRHFRQNTDLGSNQINRQMFTKTTYTMYYFSSEELEAHFN